MPSHDERIRRHYDHPAAEDKIIDLLADMRGSIYVDSLDIWKLRQLARHLVRKGWTKIKVATNAEVAESAARMIEKHRGSLEKLADSPEPQDRHTEGSQPHGA